MVLGVQRCAELSKIKHAYRSAIERYHPGRFVAGTDPDKFMAARAAYEVLSDRNRRWAYDAKRDREGIAVRITDVRETIRRRRPPIPKDLYMEVVLTPEEAQRWGIFPVAVPVVVPCSD